MQDSGKSRDDNACLLVNASGELIPDRPSNYFWHIKHGHAALLFCMYHRLYLEDVGPLDHRIPRQHASSPVLATVHA